MLATSGLTAISTHGNVYKLSASDDSWKLLTSGDDHVQSLKRLSSVPGYCWGIGIDHQLYLNVQASELPARVQEVSYENERWIPVLGWSSKNLLPGDPWPWSDNLCTLQRNRDDVKLPSNSWVWEADWHVDENVHGFLTDKGGWRYSAIDFHKGFTHVKKMNSCIRRRKWIRYRRYASVNEWVKIKSISLNPLEEPLMDLCAGGYLIPDQPPGYVQLWAVTVDGLIYFRSGIHKHCPEGLGWERIEDANIKDYEVLSISAGPTGLVWILTWSGELFVRLGINRKSLKGTHWQAVDSPCPDEKLMQVAVGVNSVWIVSSTGRVWFRKNVCSEPEPMDESKVIGSGWLEMVNRFSMISVGPNDQVFGIDFEEHCLYYRQGITSKELSGQTWKQIDLPFTKTMSTFYPHSSVSSSSLDSSTQDQELSNCESDYQYSDKKLSDCEPNCQSSDIESSNCESNHHSSDKKLLNCESIYKSSDTELSNCESNFHSSDRESSDCESTYQSSNLNGLSTLNAGCEDGNTCVENLIGNEKSHSLLANQSTESNDNVMEGDFVHSSCDNYKNEKWKHDLENRRKKRQDRAPLNDKRASFQGNSIKNKLLHIPSMAVSKIATKIPKKLNTVVDLPNKIGDNLSNRVSLLKRKMGNSDSLSEVIKEAQLNDIGISYNPLELTNQIGVISLKDSVKSKEEVESDLLASCVEESGRWFLPDNEALIWSWCSTGSLLINNESQLKCWFDNKSVKKESSCFGAQVWRPFILSELQMRQRREFTPFSHFESLVEQTCWVKKGKLKWYQDMHKHSRWLDVDVELMQDVDQGNQAIGSLNIQYKYKGSHKNIHLPLSSIMCVQHMESLSLPNIHPVMLVFTSDRLNPSTRKSPIKLSAIEYATIEDWVESISDACLRYNQLRKSPYLHSIWSVTERGDVFVQEPQPFPTSDSTECQFWHQVPGHFENIFTNMCGVSWGLGYDSKAWAYTGNLQETAKQPTYQTDSGITKIYENQRWNPVSGYTDRGFPYDPFMWSDKSGNYEMTFDNTRLESKYWSWASDWQVDQNVCGGVDQNGWQYAKGFQSKFSSVKKLRSYVRRRRWLRKRRITTNSPWVEIGTVPLREVSLQIDPESSETNLAVWAVDLNGEVLCRKGVTKSNPQGDLWVHIPTDQPFTSISVGGHYLIWATGQDGSVWLRLGVNQENITGHSWLHVAPPLKTKFVSISAGMSEIWCIDLQDDLWFRLGCSHKLLEGTCWEKVTSDVRSVSVSPLDKVWIIKNKLEMNGQTEEGVVCRLERSSQLKESNLCIGIGAGWKNICSRAWYQ